MMKKILLSLFVILGLLFAVLVAKAPSVLGFSIWNLGHAIDVSTAMSSKLACSAKYVTGLNEQQIVEDLASYSPAAKVVTLNYDDERKRVTATLFGLANTSAQYRQGLGCSLVMKGSEKLDNVLVKTSFASKQTWPKASNNEHINPLVQTLLSDLLEQDNAEELNTRALLMIQKGKIIAEQYAEGINENSLLLGWSMAKSFTAIMLGRMQQLGMVETSQMSLFPQWQQDKRAKLTLKQLLQMSSGLAFDETYAPGSDATHMLFTAPSASDVAIVSELEKEPSSFFSYSSGATNLLNRFVHQQLGNSTQASVNFLITEVFAPLNMNQSIFETDSSGIFVGSSYLYASARDWAKLGLMMVNKGRVGDSAFLPSEWVKSAAQPNNSDNDKRYGYQFWLNSGGDNSDLRWPSLPQDAYAMMGNRMQSVMMIPSHDTVFVRLGWTKGEYPMEQHYQQLLALASQGVNRD